jgi:ketosteroid isomerase-like protein
MHRFSIRSIRGALCLLVVLSQPFVMSARGNPQVEAAIKSSIASLWKAWETEDRVLADSVYHSTFTDIDFAGERRSREAVLAFFPAVRPTPNANNRAEIKISDHAFTHTKDAVVVSYLGEDSRYRDGKVVARWRFRANDTFVNEKGRWKLLAGQQALVGVPDAKAEILAVQDRFARAVLAGDTEAAARTMHDKWVLTAPAGWQATKQKFLKDMASFWKPTVQRYEDVKVEVFGNTAIVTGKAFFEWKSGPTGKGGSAEEQYTEVYAYFNYGQWLRVAAHHSCVKGDCAQ